MSCRNGDKGMLTAATGARISLDLNLYAAAEEHGVCSARLLVTAYLAPTPHTVVFKMVKHPASQQRLSRR